MQMDYRQLESSNLFNVIYQRTKIYIKNKPIALYPSDKILWASADVKSLALVMRSKKSPKENTMKIYVVWHTT